MDMYMCAKFQGLSLKNGVDIWTLVRKTGVLYVVAWNYLFLVWGRVFALCSTKYLNRQVISSNGCVKRFTDSIALECMQSPR